MAHKQETPAAGAAGASDSVLLGSLNTSEDTARDHHLQQARHDVTTFDEWFDAEPVFYKGQAYYALGSEPCIRKDGKPATLMRWRSRCAQCGEPFEFERSIKTPSVPNRRCELHKRPGVRVRKLVDGGRL
jgi:hypothetical protein